MTVDSTEGRPALTQSAQMEDPRIADLLEHQGELGSDGRPTRLAMTAERVCGLLDEIDQLRGQLRKLTAEVEKLETQLAGHEVFDAQGTRHRDHLMNEMLDVRARAALATSASASASLLRQYREKQANLAEYESDSAEDGGRLETLRKAGRDKARDVKRTRELIARRLETLNSFLDKAEVATAPPGRATAAPRAARGRRPARRVIRRVRRRR